MEWYLWFIRFWRLPLRRSWNSLSYWLSTFDCLDEEEEEDDESARHVSPALLLKLSPFGLVRSCASLPCF